MCEISTKGKRRRPHRDLAICELAGINRNKNRLWERIASNATTLFGMMRTPCSLSTCFRTKIRACSGMAPRIGSERWTGPRGRVGTVKNEESAKSAPWPNWAREHGAAYESAVAWSRIDHRLDLADLKGISSWGRYLETSIIPERSVVPRRETRLPKRRSSLDI